MSSYRQPVEHTCSACSHRGTVDTWLVVDVTERPDLVESISDGSVRRFACEACGTRQASTTSLLVGRPGQRPELLWAPDPSADQARSSEQFQMSAFMLDRDWAGSVGQIETAVMPHEVLYAAVSRDVDADAAAQGNGTLAALDVGMQRYAAWLAGRTTARRHERMKAGILALLEAPDDAAMRVVIEEHPELLDDDTEGLMTAMIGVTLDEQLPDHADTLRQRRLILRRVRERGLDAVLPEPEAGG
jgi:CpXC protein